MQTNTITKVDESERVCYNHIGSIKGDFDMNKRESDFWDKYSLDLNDVKVIQGKPYFKLRLSTSKDPLYKKGQVCAYISTTIADKINFSGDVSFYPNSNNDIPMIKAEKGCRLEIKDSHFKGRVVVDVQKKSSLFFTNVQVSGDDGVVYVNSSLTDKKELRNCDISGKWISIENSDIDNYDIHGQSISIVQQSLLGNEEKNNTITGETITLYSDGEDICVLEKTNICGNNIDIKNDSTVVNATILDGTLIDNSEVVCDGSELSVNKATIVEGSRVICYGDKTVIEDSNIENSDITIGHNQASAKLIDKQKTFGIAKSVVSECSGDMPQFVEQSIMEHCVNACKYKRVTNCEMVKEGYGKLLFSGIFKKFGADKEKTFYDKDVDSKYITKNMCEDINKHQEKMAKNETKSDKTDKMVL